MLAIECPSCSNNTYLSLKESIYEGPYRCWKCRGLFTVRIENEELQSLEPLNEEEFERQQEMESSDR